MTAARCFLTFLFLCVAAFGQQRGTYWVEQETALSGGVEAVTVHMPTGSGRTARFIGATVYCTVACSFVIERDGTAPTTTTLATKKTNRNEPNSTAVGFFTSNVGLGRILPKNYVAAGATFTVGLEPNEILEGDNLTVRTSAVTGTAKIMIQWQEF